MGKISQAAAKYIIHAPFTIEGTVDKPDIIGAVFGQTEGLLGSDLELRELQRNGRIGRIEVTSEINSGKTSGEIQIPSSLDKAETCIIGAALEVIQRIGPCNSNIKVSKIEDIRVSKRNHVVSRAKVLLKELIEDVMPDSQEISEEVAESVRVMEITSYGKEKLPAGPGVKEDEEIIIVEGRADVLNLLKCGFKNAIAINGTSVPKSIIGLANEKTVTVFVDGDRGGDLIIRELSNVLNIDFVTKAPDGKEVEEITKKEINKALRSKIPFEQVKDDFKAIERSEKPSFKKNNMNNNNNNRNGRPRDFKDDRNKPLNNNNNNNVNNVNKKRTLNSEEKSKYKTMSEELIGTKGAYILNEESNVLGKVPISELESVLKSLKSGVKTIILDGEINSELLDIAEKSRVRILIGMDSSVKTDSRVGIFTFAEL
ncbi:DNA primase [Candidatus Woesearchaeota archaeon]|nr:DNA primase [Candidatus Woesearchaeota archaeon]